MGFAFGSTIYLGNNSREEYQVIPVRLSLGRDCSDIRVRTLVPLNTHASYWQERGPELLSRRNLPQPLPLTLRTDILNSIQQGVALEAEKTWFKIFSETKVLTCFTYFAVETGGTFCSILLYSASSRMRTWVSAKSASMYGSWAQITRIAKPGPGKGCLSTSSLGRPKSRPSTRTWKVNMNHHHQFRRITHLRRLYLNQRFLHVVLNVAT
jgi:hypothetical protein